jgi:hypothetical protein
MPRLCAWAVLAGAGLAVACAPPREEPRRLVPAYDATSGLLTALSYDADHDGRFEMTAVMEGSRVLRVEVDENTDGRPDRWERYEHAPLSADGLAADGNAPVAVRVERSAARDGRVTRWERYERGALVSVEVDRDRDGGVDRWETYIDGGLATVALDTDGDGRPDRRLAYGADGGVRVETLPAREPER